MARTPSLQSVTSGSCTFFNIIVYRRPYYSRSLCIFSTLTTLDSISPIFLFFLFYFTFQHFDIIVFVFKNGLHDISLELLYCFFISLSVDCSVNLDCSLLSLAFIASSLSVVNKLFEADLSGPPSFF